MHKKSIINLRFDASTTLHEAYSSIRLYKTKKLIQEMIFEGVAGGKKPMSSTTKKDLKKQEIECWGEKKDNFVLTKGAFAGSLLRAKHDNVQYLLETSNFDVFSMNEGDLATIMCDLTNERNQKERALFLLIGEKQFMYVTEDFAEDFDVVNKGTVEMRLPPYSSSEEEEEEEEEEK